MNNKGHGSFPLWAVFLFAMLNPFVFMTFDPIMGILALLADIILLSVPAYGIYRLWLWAGRKESK